MIDYHIQHVIANGCKYYLDNQDKFVNLFSDISENFAIKLYNKLKETNINFNQGYMKARESLPLITFKVAESTDDTENQVLSNRGYGRNNILFLNQQCEIFIYTDSLDIIRVLHRIIQSSMLLFKKNFYKAGYINIEFIDSSDVKPDDKLISDSITTYNKKLTYNAQKQLLVEPLEEELTLFWDINPNNLN